jgi:hypothetical protein
MDEKVQKVTEALWPGVFFIVSGWGNVAYGHCTRAAQKPG